MFQKIKRRCLWLITFLLMGLFVSLSTASFNLPTVLAKTASLNSVIKTEKNATDLEAQGKYFYSLNQFEQAVDLWQQAVKVYANSADILSQSRVMANISLAYSKMQNWDKATAQITASLNLLDGEIVGKKIARNRVLAQVFNNQGILQLAQGQTENAIASWQQASLNYERVGDQLGVIRTSINQASAFKNLGLYRRALKTLTKVEKQLVKQPYSTIKATGLRSYGDILRLVGNIKRSRQVLEQSLVVASNLESPQDQVKTLLALGNTLRANGNQEKALEFYQQGLMTCQGDSGCLRGDLSLQINLAQLNLLLATEYWQRGTELISEIQSDFAVLPNSRANINHKINFAHTLIKLRRKSLNESAKLKNIPAWSEIEQFLADTVEQAIAIGNQKAQSYGLGLQGQVDEQLARWDAAREYSNQALILAQSLNSPEISYLWQWQLGRINQALQNRSQAISNYTQAVEILKSLSQDLVAIDPDIQYSFRESVEPVYRGLVNLLLETDSGEEVSEANLEAGREVIESLQLAELNNFFREACLDAQSVEIDKIDRQAAVIYPIILEDRLEVILSLPEQPLRHYVTAIAKPELEATIEEFRQSIVVRSRRRFYPSAQKLYNWLIRPALEDLAHSGVKTLVFVPDGAFRNIPMGALYNGKHYLIEDYSVALTPGLQLLAPHSLEQVKLKTIAAGLSEQRQGFSALNNVSLELEEIQNKVSSVVLLNQDFTTEALQKEIKFSDYPIVHIATHGQFSSSLEDTFLLAWNSRIHINELDSILQTRTPNRENAIELLVLSACETATGDQWAALGLAGMAVRAGARSTLATLWSVNDRATAELMSKFYQELATKHVPKAEAIRQAQLQLLHSQWYRHPFYWAPYVLLGNWL